jgi:hypothetical protein
MSVIIALNAGINILIAIIIPGAGFCSLAAHTVRAGFGAVAKKPIIALSIVEAFHALTGVTEIPIVAVIICEAFDADIGLLITIFSRFACLRSRSTCPAITCFFTIACHTVIAVRIV